MVVFGEADLRRLLKSYASYYNRVRTHLSLNKNAPLYRPRQTVGNIVRSWVGSIIYMFGFEFSVTTGGLHLAGQCSRTAERD